MKTIIGYAGTDLEAGDLLKIGSDGLFYPYESPLPPQIPGPVFLASSPSRIGIVIEWIYNKFKRQRRKVK